MAVTKQEADVQIRALTQEIEGYERAIAIRQNRANAARARGDEKNALFLEEEVANAKRSVQAAKEQLAYYGGQARTRQQRKGQTR